jgi:DNA-binding NtrC family response regulator
VSNNHLDRRVERGEKPGHTVLVVESEINLLEFLVRLIGHEQLTILAASGTPSALAMLGARQIDAVICDLSLAKDDCGFLLHEIRRTQPDSPRILTISQSEVDTAKRIVARGDAERFVVVPGYDSELLFAIQQGLEANDTLKERRRLSSRMTSNGEA